MTETTDKETLALLATQEFEHKYGLELGKIIYRYEMSQDQQKRALTLDAQGKWREALELLARVKEIQRQAFNGKEDEPHIPQLLHNIGVVYAEQGEYNKAIDVYRSSLDLQRKLTGDEHPGVASALMNLGNAFQEVENPRLDRSQLLYEKALAIRRVVLDSKDPLLADTLHQLALTHEKQAGKRYRRPGGLMMHQNERGVRNIHHSTARNLYWECLDIRVHVLGDTHIDTMATLFNLGLSLRNACIFRRSLWTPFNRKRKAMELSRKLLQRALRSMDTSPHTDKEECAACLQYLATVECEFENWEEAMHLFDREFKMVNKLFEPGAKFWTALRNGIDVTPKKGILGEALCGKAMCLIRLNRLPDALDVYGEAVKLLRGCTVIEDAAQKTSWKGNVAAKIMAMKMKAKIQKKMKGRQAACEITKRDVGPRIMGLLEMADRCFYTTDRRIKQLEQIKQDKIEKIKEIKVEERRLRMLGRDGKK